MFLSLKEYRRPQAIEEALRLLARPGSRALAGGTAVVGPVDATTEVLVDLAGLGLRYARPEGDTLRVGALTPLADLLDSLEVNLAGGGVLAQAALRAGPPTLLNRATIGGAVARPDRAGELVAVLLALDTRVSIVAEGPDGAPPARSLWDLPVFLERRTEILRGALIEELQIPTRPVAAALERVARTPRDAPVVAVAAALRLDGPVCRHVRLAAAGLYPGPRRLVAAEAVLEGVILDDDAVARAARQAREAGDPPDDLRGRPDYRRHLGEVLVRRAVVAARAAALDEAGKE